MPTRRTFCQQLGLAATTLLTPRLSAACPIATLLEIGWHTPSPQDLLANLALYEARVPFNGLILELRNNGGRPTTNYLLAYNAWHARSERADTYSQATTALRQVTQQTTRFRENLLDLKCQPGTNDWFDDAAWARNWTNCQLLAQLARDTGCKGLFIDTEHYSYGSPFTWAPSTTTARDTTKSFVEYQAKVRQRGQEFQTTLQTAFPGLCLLLSMGYSKAFSLVTPTRPLAQTAYGLLPAFLDGMLDVTTVPLYDGYEQGYAYTTAPQFTAVAQAILTGTGATSPRYAQYYKPSFGLWLDYQRQWNTTTFAGNTFQPATWQTALSLARAMTARYVWVYTERANWYDGSMPPAYQAATMAALDH